MIGDKGMPTFDSVAAERGPSLAELEREHAAMLEEVRHGRARQSSLAQAAIEAEEDAGNPDCKWQARLPEETARRKDNRSCRMHVPAKFRIG